VQVAQALSAVTVQAALMYWPAGQAPEHDTHVPFCPLPQPVTYCPDAQARELGQLAQTRSAVEVQPETSYCVALQAVQGTAGMTVKLQTEDR
jgi:hypothetical protein